MNKDRANAEDMKAAEAGKNYKIEGADFEKVKEAMKKCDEKKKALEGFIEQAKEEAKGAHDVLWDAIKEVLPQTKDESVNHVIDTAYEDLGVYFIREQKEGCRGSTALKALIDSLASRGEG